MKKSHPKHTKVWRREISNHFKNMRNERDVKARKATVAGILALRASAKPSESKERP